MSRPQLSAAHGTYAIRVIVALAILLTGLAGLAGGTAAAGGPDPAMMTVRVVDGEGRAQYPAAAAACPYVGATFVCSNPIIEQVGQSGVAMLRLDPAVRYHVVAIVRDPSPAWACPGTPWNGGMIYISPEALDGTPEELPAFARFTVDEPDPSDCAPPPPGTAAEIRIFDEVGNPLPAAFLGVCQYDPATPPTYPPPAVTVCNPAEWWAGSGGTGVIRIQVDPDLMYDITGFLSCTDGWFLFSSGNFTQFGYSVWRLSGADLLANGLEMTIYGDIATCVGA